jgi:hypothetical protein
MVRIGAIAWMLAAVLAGQSAGELLQKGIYTQETVGDLDGAIRIYRQILNSASESRAVAAQAQYRLGLCLQGKGDSAGAAQAFRKLVKAYPEQTELVAKAQQKLTGVNLIPVPWPDHEYAEYRIVGNGRESEGAITYSIEPSQPSPSSANRMILRLWYSDVPVRYRAEVDRETLAPVSTWYKTDSSFVETEFQDGMVRITTAGKPPRSLPVKNGVYDAWEFPFVLRRLPLEENYRAEIPILLVGLTMPLELQVTAIEDVEVPAGKFHCFKVTLDWSPAGMHDFWFSTDASRIPVKFSLGTMNIELTRLNSTGPEPTTYRGEGDGVSFTAPAGWVVDKPQPADGGMIVKLNDPEGQSTGAWVFYRQRNQVARAQIDARQASETEAEKEKRMARNGKPNYKYRATERFQLKGYEAWRSVADYTTANNRPKVEWVAVVQSAKTLVNIWGEGIEPADLDSFVARFQPVVDSLVVP